MLPRMVWADVLQHTKIKLLPKMLLRGMFSETRIRQLIQTELKNYRDRVVLLILRCTNLKFTKVEIREFLYSACSYSGHLAMIPLLITKYNLTLNDIRFRRCHAFRAAFEARKYRTMKFFFGFGFTLDDLCKTKSDGESKLDEILELIESDDEVRSLRLFFAQGLTIEYCMKHMSFTGMCKFDAHRTLFYLIHKGLRVDNKDERQKGLLKACKYGYAKLIRLLLNAHIVTHVDIRESKAINVARKSKNFYILKLLTNHLD